MSDKPYIIDAETASAILEGSSFGIAMFELPSMKMVWHNACFKRLTWFGRADGGKKSTHVMLKDLFRDQDIEAVEKLVNIAIQTGFSYDSERPMLRGGRRTFMSKISFRTFNQQSQNENDHICIEVVDLSLEKLYEELKSREEQLRRTQAELVQKSKMASIGEMAGGIAHEINNPLAIIDGRAHYLKLMLDDEDFDKKKALNHIKSICDTVTRAANIVKSIRSISEENSAEEFQAVDLGQIIDTTAAIYREKLKNEGISFPVELPEREAPVMCNPAQVSQVILNLLKNSHEALIRATTESKWIRIRNEISDKNFRFFVEDNGDGIAKGIKHRIMDPFFTTKDVGEGTGLGLSIAHRIIYNHKGYINVHSETGYTSFEIVLPLIVDEKSQNTKDKQSA